MTVRDDMLNGHAICHGGFIFTLADSAFAFACNSYNLNTVAQGCAIDILAPAHGGDVLTPSAHERSRGRPHRRLRHRSHATSTARPSRLFRGKSYRIKGHVVEEAPRAFLQPLTKGARMPAKHPAPGDLEPIETREPRRARGAAARSGCDGRSRTRTTTSPHYRQAFDARGRASGRSAHARRSRAVSVHRQDRPARQLSVRHVRRAARAGRRASTRRRARPASRRSSATRATTSTPGRR